jgi:Ca-activated chloride channel homolog
MTKTRSIAACSLIAAGCVLWPVLLLSPAGAALLPDEVESGAGPPSDASVAPPKQGPEPRVNITPRAPAGAEPKAGDDSLAHRETDIRVDTDLVLIPVTVTTPLQQVVTGMEAEHFRLYEDGVEQKIKYFASEDAPLSVGLVFDASGSMGSKLAKARLAAAQFFKTANPRDEFFLIQFNDRPQMVMSFTSNVAEIQNRLTFTESKGRTALLDAVYMAIHEMHKARNPRRAILILSDGGDNSSRYTESDIKNLVREADVQIYAMGIYEPMGGRGRTPEELAGPSLLGELTEQTGGHNFSIENLNDLPDVAAKIGVELRSQYVLGYSPTNKARDGKYRKVQVKLNQPRGLPPLRAAWRRGYYAPSQ